MSDLIYIGDGEFLAGIPKRDLSGDELQAMTAADRERVLNSDLWLGAVPSQLTAQVLPGVGDEIISALNGAGFETIADIQDATDEALLAVSGIGPQRLENIRAVIDTAAADSDSEV